MVRSQTNAKDAEEAARLNAGRYSTQNPPELSAVRHLLEHYSGVLPDAVDGHIREIVGCPDRGGTARSFEFLDIDPTLQDPAFQAVSKRLLEPGATEALLEVGCCLGPIIRHLVAQGVPGERLYGTDLLSQFIELGFDLFRDRSLIRATFVCGDMLDDNDARLEQLNGKVDIIFAESFFHLFGYHDQKKAAKRMVGFLKKDSLDPVIFGKNGGKKISGWEKYILDGDAFSKLWDEVGEETATSWSAETNVEQGDDWIQVTFIVRRDGRSVDYQ